jgi:anaerobic magnesium-protoporphyrin IX monomethyl ester cyclase
MENYRFLKSTGADSSYCQILTPYPKTGIRQYLLDENLVTNPDDFSRYNGIWANVRTRALNAETLQYMVWYHRQSILGWWNPSQRACEEGRSWIAIWIYIFRPLLKIVVGRSLKKYGWKGRYEREIARLKSVNRFPDLDA